MTARRPTTTRKAAFPRLPSSGHPAFWLAALLRNQAALQALDHAHAVACRRHKYDDHPLLQGLTCGLLDLRHDVKTSAEYTRDEGLLPFAWAGTRYFDEVAA